MRPINPVQHVLKLSNDYRRAINANGVVFQRERVVEYIGWKPPKLNFVKLNIDGACSDRKRASCELWEVLEGLCL
ncbi:hypothetical protein A2U01_0045720, partial [Trifolium medium]|nr:hypothetical protein [Trifolium medium]